MRTLLKVHEDVHTVPEAIGKMMDAYAAEGYRVERLSSMNFKITLQGGWVHIYWQDGRIWQEIIEEKEEKNTAESAKELTDAKPTKKENEQARRQQESAQVTIRLHPGLKEALQREADRQGNSLDGLIVDLLTEACVPGNWETGSTPRKRGKRLEVAVDITKDLELMDRDELKAYARAKGIRLYTVVPEKIRKKIREIEYARAHHGDAFRNPKK